MRISCFIIALLLLFSLNIFCGSIHIPASQVAGILLSAICGEASDDTLTFIIIRSRLPQAVAALLCGASLSTAGLLLQTAFRNPLAGPSVFGITNGASLAVAIMTLSVGSTLSAAGSQLTMVGAAFIGAIAVTGIILSISTIVRSNAMLLIVGIMIGYIASSAITLLNFFATEDGIRSFLLWGMGDFGSVSAGQLPLFSLLTVSGILASLLLVKPLNTMLLGDRYAASLGTDIRNVRNKILFVTGLLSAVATAYCGPVAFIGLAVPHMARLVTRTDNHRELLPATIILGAAVALLCNLITTMPSDGTMLPLNAITPVIGAPVIIYVIIRKKR